MIEVVIDRIQVIAVLEMTEVVIDQVKVTVLEEIVVLEMIEIVIMIYIVQDIVQILHRI
jgi:hypothetical protein